MVIHLMLLGEVYKEFNIGPKTEPWGTPWVRYNDFDKVSFTFTYCVRSDKYETNQSNALPRIPKRVESLRVKIVWSTVSNAADKSRRTRMTEWPLSIAVTISLSTFFNAVFGPWNFLYANNFHIYGFLLSFALKQRLEAIREWPNIGFKQFFLRGNSVSCAPVSIFRASR